MPETPQFEDAGRFERLIAELNSGSQTAATELVRVYGPCLRRAVRRTLKNELRDKYDSTDFAQAVWKSFFTTESLHGGIRTPDQLVRLLTVMARNKVVDEQRRRKKGKYGQALELRTSQHPGDHEPSASDPTPSEVAMARERLIKLSEGEPKHGREILTLRAEGRTYEEIARRLGVSDKTVQRALKRIRKDLANEEAASKGNDSTRE